MSNRRSTASLDILALAAAALPVFAGDAASRTVVLEEPESPFSLETSVGIDSSYVSEGVDNVPDTEWYYATVDFTWNFLGFSAFYGRTTDGSYDELDLSLGYSKELGPVTLTAGYTFLTYPETDDPDGHEVYVALDYSPIEWLTFAALGYYDFADIDGGFVELSAASSIPIIEGRLSIDPYILLGVDFGYVSDEHDAVNNFQVGVEVPFAITEHLSLVLAAHHSWALENLEDEELSDVSWAGAKLVYSF
jgi:hypothetical protein